MSNGGDETGPIDYLIVEFPGNGMTGEGFPILVDLVDRGIIRILDLVFVTKRDDGSVEGIAIADLDGDGELDLAVFEGASSGLDRSGRSRRGGRRFSSRAARRGSSSTRTCGPRPSPRRCAAAALSSSRSGPIPVDALVAALDAADA